MFSIHKSPVNPKDPSNISPPECMPSEYKPTKMITYLYKLRAYMRDFTAYNKHKYFQNFMLANTNWMASRIYPGSRSLDAPDLRQCAEQLKKVTLNHEGDEITLVKIRFE